MSERGIAHRKLADADIAFQISGCKPLRYVSAHHAQAAEPGLGFERRLKHRFEVLHLGRCQLQMKALWPLRTYNVTVRSPQSFRSNGRRKTTDLHSAVVERNSCFHVFKRCH